MKIQASHVKQFVSSGLGRTSSGEYFIDPTKSGDPFKVFCDMKTDGGELEVTLEYCREHDCDHTSSDEYFIDQTKSGDPYIVFCNMETDGGELEVTLE